jgi:hypothetical protein
MRRSPYHTVRANCLCQACYRTVWEEVLAFFFGWCFLWAMLLFSVVRFGAFTNCREIGRYRHAFNVELMSHVKQYHTCLWLDSVVLPSFNPWLKLIALGRSGRDVPEYHALLSLWDAQIWFSEYSAVIRILKSSFPLVTTGWWKTVQKTEF